MMRKIYPAKVITLCNECPEYMFVYENFQDFYHWCKLASMEMEEEEFLIPKWCPLADEEEGK